ncbi:Phosphomannomutase 1 [Naganishia vaughanmartiniae]|uniref:Phosphomannomutase 1 n=1 Tax=Naganishia vaughanmartiniae TaxID=1424756 RepID=A0ACC2XNP1_9TREE|nr:Phosphomannomutase 1 [Naganishia vaughanmartiniae]
MSEIPAGTATFAGRTHPKTICMFDVDGTLTVPRQQASKEMLQLLRDLRKECVIAFVGGSDLVKIAEQLAVDGQNVVDDFDYGFSENGLVAYKLGKEIARQSFINFVGEEEYKKFVKFVLHYIADLDIPIKRGTFIEFRNGMVNISPIGRNASNQERNEYEVYDKKNGIRAKLVEILQKEFAHLGLTYSIGGQISFDVFPTGWDKTYSLRHIEPEGFTEIHFFGDKTYKGGNDYEIYNDPRTIGHSVNSPDDTMRILKELFFSKK